MVYRIKICTVSWKTEMGQNIFWNSSCSHVLLQLLKNHPAEKKLLIKGQVQGVIFVLHDTPLTPDRG